MINMRLKLKKNLKLVPKVVLVYATCKQDVLIIKPVFVVNVMKVFMAMENRASKTMCRYVYMEK